MIVANLRILQDDPHNKDERENAVSNLHDLAKWLEDGGFPPDVMKACAQMVAQEVVNNPLFQPKADEPTAHNENR